MNRLVSKALAALGFAISANAVAQTEPTLYGLVDMAAGRFQLPGSTRVLGAESGRMSLSYVGVRGSDDLGGGLRARFALETYLSVNRGAAGRSDADPFWARTAYVGLQGSFGTSWLGRLPTPLWLSTRLFNPFGDSFGFSPSIRQYFGGSILGDSRWNNSIAFATPEVDNGLRYSVQYNAGEGEPGSTGKNVGANVLYTAGPLSATGTWQRVRNNVSPAPPGFDHQTAFQFGASYEWRIVKLYGQAGSVTTHATTAIKSRLYQLGAVSPIGLGFLMVSYGHAGDDVNGSHFTRKTLSIGYDYFLSKATDIYAVAMNERATALSSGNTIAAGVRLRF